MSTSKRIAQAYVQLGQLSSAILEYETILQLFPEDPDAQAALKSIESKASNFAVEPAMAEPAALKPGANANRAKKGSGKPSAPEVEDGQQMMRKVFVDGKIISAGDFDL